MTIHARHVDVADHQAERLALQRRQGCFRAVDSDEFMPAEQQGVGKGFAQGAVVLDQQDFDGHRVHSL
ncbi:hypothetical protein D3C81_1785520 [compost metagenome]